MKHYAIKLIIGVIIVAIAIRMSDTFTSGAIAGIIYSAIIDIYDELRTTIDLIRLTIKEDEE